MPDTPGFPFTCFVPGPWPPGGTLALGDRWSTEWIPNDGRFSAAFAGTAVPPERRAELDRCPGAWVIEGRVDPLADPRPLQDLARALVAAGALAVRVEQSKAGYLVGEWADLLAAGQLFAALVVLVVGEAGPSTCGMHLFGLPDAAIGNTTDDGARIVSSLCLYQLHEAPLLLSGHTFAPDADTPRHTLERWPADAFPHSHPCWNPFGVWRLLPPGERRAPQLPRHFMPALVAQLAAAEHQAGRALEKSEVEALRDSAMCITMEPADARAMERARGYADVDPELVWEQWEVLRDGMRGR
jgi:hypothetical protein